MKRPKGSKEKVPVACPTCVVDYNSFMGRVDLTDQYLSYYTLTSRKTVKWWKKVFWCLIDMSILNSFIIFKTNFPTSHINTHRLYRLELVHELVQPLLDLRSDSDQLPYSKGRKGTSADKRLVGKHFAYKSTKRNRCVVCYKDKTEKGSRKDKKIMTVCQKCNLHMCIGSCFEKYHTRSKY